MSRIIHCTQNDDLWQVARIGRITGSRIGDLLAPPTTRASTRKGVPFPAGSEAQCKADYRHELTIERIYGRAANHPTNQYMRDGSEREPFARMLYEAENQCPVELVGFALHDEWDWFGCSPDGIMRELRRGLELKCPTEETHDSYVENPELLAEEYKGQCLGGLICFPEFDSWDLQSFNPYAPDAIKTVKAPTFHRSDWAETIARIEDEAQTMNAQIEAEIQRRGLPPTVWSVMP